MNVLHVAAEAFPLVKTGGLGDVAGALPHAQRAAGIDARLLLPGYPAVLKGLREVRNLRELGPAFGAARMRLVTGVMPDTGLPVIAVDSPWHFGRAGGPYQDAHGVEWADNLPRFALLGWLAAHLAASALDPEWTPAIVHAHDWHAGLACAYLHAHPARAAATVFTIHNLAFQGRFEMSEFGSLGLPPHYAGLDGIEFYRALSMLKGGLQLADRVTTVSPTYAREIATPEFGCGLEDVVRNRGAAVSGILNGIDEEVWNPNQDAVLASPYDAHDLAGKAACKRDLQESLGLAVDPAALLVCIVSRLSDQKGLDLLLGALPALLNSGGQLALQGTGEPALEKAFEAAAAQYPDRVAVRIAYDESMAHRFVAGADAICVPSRFEPCGLTQLYGLRYGTLPIVRRVGGLADTVSDAGDEREPRAGATGFTFEAATAGALAQAFQRAAARFRDRPAWNTLQQSAMATDHAWTRAARSYIDVYDQALAARGI
ncbi:MAG TPA: glycogen synthase GlgA [Burkholderiaceae bacterium]|jgi:starch synthase|nr:glycogen synthase GlgA [Burkholderiaceae bacterium]